MEKQITQEEIQEKIAAYIMQTYNISSEDKNFTYTVNLFEEGYVDSIGLVKFIAFMEESFGITVEEDVLYDERFLTIQGQSEIVLELMDEALL
jgi:acyl carrier protein